MRECYKKYWKTTLVERMRSVFPDFVLKESVSRKVADQQNPSAKPIKFVWNAIDKLIFTIEFAAPGKQDKFEGYCGWSEKGKGKASEWLADDPFGEPAFELTNTITMIQDLSAALGDDPRVYWWSFWAPKVPLDGSVESEAIWKTELVVEELRAISDEEARSRVKVAVEKAMVDIQRCAAPWFEKKLEWYRKHKL